MRDAARPSLRSHPVLLWSAFIAVHLILAAGNALGPGRPLRDVTVLYRSWAELAVGGQSIVGISTEWVYPVLALVPMLIALVGGEAYGVAWVAMVTLLNAAAFAMLIGRRSPRLAVVAWWWLGFLLLLGPIAIGRIDAVTVPIGIIGVLILARRPTLATTLFTVAAWIKVWPAAIVTALVIVRHDRWRLAGIAAGVSALIVASAWLFGGGGAVLSFITAQTGRGLQVEAPISLIWLWQAAAGVAGATVYYDRDIVTYQVTGAGVDVAAAWATPAMALAMIAVASLGVRAVRAGTASGRVLPPLALGLVVTLIAFNKVGSPQFVCWLAVPVILGLVARVHGSGGSFRSPAILTLVIALATQLIYPWFYEAVEEVQPLILAVLTVRNLLYFVLLGWAVRDLWRLARPLRPTE